MPVAARDIKPSRKAHFGTLAEYPSVDYAFDIRNPTLVDNPPNSKGT